MKIKSNYNPNMLHNIWYPPQRTENKSLKEKSEIPLTCGFKSITSMGFIFDKKNTPEKVFNLIREIMSSKRIKEFSKLKKKYITYKKRLFCVDLKSINKNLKNEKLIIASKISKYRKDYILKTAVTLSLCSENVYYPEKELIITPSSINRVVELYEVKLLKKG